MSPGGTHAVVPFSLFVATGWPLNDISSNVQLFATPAVLA
jgi:hypothetical protein